MNAEDAEQGRFPYMASIYEVEVIKMHKCGGAIVSNRYVLTVATCVKHYALENRTSQIVVYPGAWKLNRDAATAKVSEVKIHPEYTFKSSRNNIALVKTADQMLYSDFVKPISLPMSDFSDINSISLVVSGFGASEVFISSLSFNYSIFT